eukprot:jgi/Mesvir1/16577/Mv10113-RA.1
MEKFFGRSRHNPLKREREEDLEPCFEKVRKLLQKVMVDSTIDTALEALKVYPAVRPEGGSLTINNAYHTLQDNGLNFGNQNFHLLHMQLRHVAEIYHDSPCQNHRDFLESQFSLFVWQVLHYGWKVSPAVAAVCGYAVTKAFLLAMDNTPRLTSDHLVGPGLVMRVGARPRSAVSSQSRPWQMDAVGALMVDPVVEERYERELASRWNNADEDRWMGHSRLREDFPSADEKERRRQAKEDSRLAWVWMTKQRIMSRPEICHEWAPHEEWCALVSLSEDEFRCTGLWWWPTSNDDCLYRTPWAPLFDSEEPPFLADGE